jgi:hypothetical protein
MSWNSSPICLLLALSLIVGCRTSQVKPVPREHIESVCLENNPIVVVEGFEDNLRQQLLAKGIQSEVYYDATPPADCVYRVTYTARQEWDRKPFLAYAAINLYRGGELLGGARYKASDGIDLSKYDPAESKVNPLIDELLRNVNSD